MEGGIGTETVHDKINNSEKIVNKTLVYAEDLRANSIRLKDRKYFNFYGAFEGSEGDFRFHLRQEMERMAQKEEIIFVSRNKPKDIDESSNWFVESVLGGKVNDIIAATYVEKKGDYPPGEMYRAIMETAKKKGLDKRAVASVVESFVDIKQALSHNLPYLENGQKSEIKVMFPIKFKENEKLEADGDLPVEYALPLEKIKRQAPNEFYEQAVKCAHIFYNLDQGKTGPEEDKFASELANLPSVASIGLFNGFGGVGFEAATPKWLHGRKKEDIKSQGIPKIAGFYEKYVEEKSDNIHKETNGVYADYDKNWCPPESESLSDNFKAYMETDCSRVELEGLFNELAYKKIHPHSSKLFEENRLVLYWQSELKEDLEKNLREVFDNHKIEFRGFGQDPLRIEIDETGNWEIKMVGSNDKSRGEAGGGGEFFKHLYNPQKFFELYLQQMFKWGRNPLDSYKNSFVPIIGDVNKVSDKEALSATISEIKTKGLGAKEYQNFRDLILF